MPKRVRYILVAALLLITGSEAAAAQSSAGTGPTCSVPLRPGRWLSGGGSPFWIQCAGTEIFWLGMNKGGDTARQGTMWAQVGHGTVHGNRIDLRWSDVPYGTIRTEGRIQLRIEADTLLQVTRDDGPFGMSRIHWVASK